MSDYVAILLVITSILLIYISSLNFVLRIKLDAANRMIAQIQLQNDVNLDDLK